MEPGGTYVLDLGRHSPIGSPCGCGPLSLFCASLIPQAWMKKSHLPATLCRCGKWYYSWRKESFFPVSHKTPTKE